MCNLRLILGFTLAASLPFAIAQAAPADLPETGQTSCYTAAGVVMPSCLNTGQDGELRAGVPWPAPRLVVGAGAMLDCVTDNLTGLMWVRAPGTTLTTWANALTAANGLTLCGFSDWRLPNVTELESLVNHEVANQATFLNAQSFVGVQANYYWSSSSLAGSAANAWIVHMGGVYPGGGVVGVNLKSNNLYVWPVRAGQ